MGNNIRSSSRPKALAPSIPMPPLADAMDAVHLSVDRFCLLAGVEALAEMMEEDATTVCGARHRRHGDRRGYRWGRTPSEIGYHGGKVKVARPRVRRLKAYRQLPILRNALQEHLRKAQADSAIETIMKAA